MLDPRNITDRATLTDFFTALLSRSVRQRQQADELKMIFAKALAESAAKQALPSSEDQVKNRILALATHAGQRPEPLGGYNLPERVAGIPEQVESAAQQRELGFLTYLLPRQLGLGNVNVYALDNQGNVVPAKGGENLPPRSRVFQERVTPEEAGQVTGSRTQARIAAESSPEGLAAASKVATAKAQANPPLEKTNSVISAESSLRSLDELRQFASHPKSFLTRGIPGLKGARAIQRIFKNLELEIVTARGGKTLTQSERQLVFGNFPSRLDALDAMIRHDPKEILNKIDEMETKARSLTERVPIREQSLSTSSPAAEAAKTRLRAKYGR